MAQIRANGIEIEYERFGDEGADPILLVMGLGAQLLDWPEAFCEELASGGHHVIRYDNRDVGLSTKFHEAGIPDLMTLLSGGDAPVPYTLEDMADDAVALLSALSIDRAHIVGASLGGMIAQTVAIEHPARTHTLTSIMSNTGSPDEPKAAPDVGALLVAPRPTEREARIEQSVNTARAIAGSGFPFDEDSVRKRTALKYDRSRYTVGAMRQLAAIARQGSREEALRTLAVPTLVIHGADDPLVPVECGRRTADAIPGAKLHIIEGWGHSLPVQVHGEIAGAIVAHAADAQR